MTPAQEAEEKARQIAQAAHLRSSLQSRRDLGLRIVVAAVTLDLLILKGTSDVAARIVKPQDLVHGVRAIAVTAFLVTFGMLGQIEINNRRERNIYLALEKDALPTPVKNPPAYPRLRDWIVGLGRRLVTYRVGRACRKVGKICWAVLSGPWVRTLISSWATTWPLAGMAVLTIVIWRAAPILANVR